MAYWDVQIWDMERGWGRSLGGNEYFAEKDKAKALEFVKKYNSANTSDTVPDFYSFADEPVLREGRKPKK